MFIDIIVLSILFISSLISFLRGFIREILTIFGTVGAFAAAYFFGPLLSPVVANALGVNADAEFTTPQKLLGIIPYEFVAIALAYGSIFIVVVIILSIISHMIAETAKSMGLGAIDRSTGVVFGIVRGVFLLGLLNLPIHIFANSTENRPEFINNAIEKSSSYFYIEQTSKFIEGFLPKNETPVTVDNTEKTLKAIDIPAATKIIEDVAPAIKDKAVEGYSEDFRNKMDKLFEEEESQR